MVDIPTENCGKQINGIVLLKNEESANNEYECREERKLDTTWIGGVRTIFQAQKGWISWWMVLQFQHIKYEMNESKHSLISSMAYKNE